MHTHFHILQLVDMQIRTYIPSPFDVVDTTPKTQKSIQKSIEIG